MPMGPLLSSISQPTWSLSQHYAGAFHAVAARRTKNQGRKGDSVEEVINGWSISGTPCMKRQQMSGHHCQVGAIGLWLLVQI
jgi:hypothetical protein